MKNEELIAGMCLYGFIRRETPAEQSRCLDQISRHYGNQVAKIVMDLMGDSRKRRTDDQKKISSSSLVLFREISAEIEL